METAPATVRLADGQVDTAQQRVLRDARSVHLTTRENELLVYLATHPRRTITREELLEEVWGYPRHGSTEPVYNTVKRLRAKIEGRGPHRHIVTVHGEGYRFEPPPAAPPESPAPVAPPASRPLRPERTRFVGRKTEIDAISRRFEAGACLVTVLGPGGVGKTRVAREYHHLRAGRGDGVAAWFCDLAAARTAKELVRAVAAAVDLPLDGDDVTSWARGIARALASASPALLILDNLEQLDAGARALIATWLDAAAVLATSRERLCLTGEHVVEIGPLPVQEAVELFIDRARMATGTDLSTPERLAVVRAIVERLDRLPLAIELAAARTNLLRPEALLARLDNQLDTLTRHTVDGPDRHATLRAAVDWSWQLLTPEEQATLAQCAVFSGGFTVEAAEAVVTAGERPSPPVYECLARLRDRSLLRTRDVADIPSQTRCELYAAVQQFAAVRPLDRGALAGRHAAWALDEGERWLADLDGRGHARARAHLEVELDNLRAAFVWACAASPAEAVRLARVIDGILSLRGGAATRREVLERAWALAAGGRDRAWLGLALGALREDEGQHGAELLRTAAAEADRSAAPEIAAEARARLGQAAAARGDFAAGVRVLEEALAEAQSAGERRLEGRVSATLGAVLWRGGRVPAARAALERALAIHDEVGDLRFSAQTAGVLCHVLRADGRLVAALASLDRAETGFAALGDAPGQARTLVDRGLHLSRVGRQREAVLALEGARQSYERLGLVRGLVEVHLNLAEALMGLGEDRRALTEVHAAVATCREVGEKMWLSTALELLACAAMLDGDVGSAEAALDEALAIARAAGNTRSEATIMSKRGLCRFLRSRWADSHADFAESERLHAERGADAMAGTAAIDRAVAAAALGREAEAQEAAALARRLLGDPPEGTWIARMVALLVAASEALTALRGGRPAQEVAAEGARVRAAVLTTMAPDAQDLATRLSCLMLDHALASGPAGV